MTPPHPGCWLPLAIALLAPFAARAADPIAAPGDWRAETLPFPLEFAPTLPYRGVEHVRFAPSWKNFSAPDGFSYVFVWDIQPIARDANGLARDLQVYFAGLMGAVAKDKPALAEKAGGTTAQLALVAERRSAVYRGEVKTWNAFSDGEPLALQVDLSVEGCADGHQHWFAMVSKAPRDAGVWRAMKKIRDDSKCQ